MELLLVPLGILLVAAGLTILVLLVILARERKRANTAELKYAIKFEEAMLRASIQLRNAEARIRADAIKKSTAVVKGKVAEQLVPFQPDFGYNPRDCRFLGSPVDLIVFEGLTEGDVTRVVFIEVKSGKYARLSQREKQVRDAIENGEVDYEIVLARGRE